MNRKRITPIHMPAPRARRSARPATRPANVLATAIVLAASAVALVAPAAAAPSAHVASAQKLQLRHTSLGTVLVDSSGFTVYRFSKDTGKKNTCITTSECSRTWPALTTSGQPTAGPGRQGLAAVDDHAARRRAPGDLRRTSAVPLRHGQRTR